MLIPCWGYNIFIYEYIVIPAINNIIYGVYYGILLLNLWLIITDHHIIYNELSSSVLILYRLN